MTDYTGLTALITGGASGIGRGIAEELVARGARVAIADIEQSAVVTAAAEIRAVPFQVDVSDREAMNRLAITVAEEFGQLDILVNNAGVASLGPVAMMTPDDWRWIFGVNLFGIANGVSAFLPLLEQNSRGAVVVNTASMSGLLWDRQRGGYAATKHAVMAYTETLIDELVDDSPTIHVVLLIPGPVSTRLGTSSRNRPTKSLGALADVDLAASPAPGVRWMKPRDVGRIVVRAIDNGDRYAITHPELLAPVTAKYEALQAAFEKYPQLDE